jgi:alpha-mannosidase
VVPQEIAGIDVSGSTVKIFSGVIAEKVDIFLDSKKVLSGDYWSELRIPIVLDNRAEPQNRYVVAVHIYPKNKWIPNVGVPLINIAYSRVEEKAFELDSFIQELRFAKILDGKLTGTAAEEFDLNVFDKSPSIIVDHIEKSRIKLSSLSEKAKEFEVHLAAHAHIDMNWFWSWGDTITTIKDTFGTMVRLMDRYPDFRFSQSQAATYKVAEQKFPGIFKTIQQYVEKSNWDIIASMWTEADLNMVGTEALVRQFLEAKLYVKKRFGFEPQVCWGPDTFGHTWTLPQIMIKTGCKYYYFNRCDRGHPIFWWRSPDGSKVLVYRGIGWYGNTVTPKNVVDTAVELYNRYGLKVSMFVFGVGDHGGGATTEDIKVAHQIQKRKVLPKVFFSSTHRFFEEVEKELLDKTIPVINDELQFVFDGCYTTHGDIKRYNRLCERLLVDAEKFSVFSGKYPKDVLRKAWRNTLFNQFHDILDGSGSSEAYIYPIELAEEAVKIADETLKASLERLTEEMKFSMKGVPIVVFNSLSWDRVDVVKVKVPKSMMPRNPIVVSADDEKEYFVQVSDDEVIFVATVPSMGYKTYYLVEMKRTEGDSSGLTSGENVLENEYFRVEIETESGTISSLRDKDAGRFVFNKNRYPGTRPIFSNLLRVLYELPHGMSAWIIGEISRTENLIRGAETELVEIGPVRATIKTVHHYR